MLTLPSRATPRSADHLADTDGREVLVARPQRLVQTAHDPQIVGNGSHCGVLSSKSGKLISRHWKEPRYDPRAPARFEAALALPADDGAVGWTAPYRFSPPATPVSLPRRWTADDGKRYIIAFDLQLAELSPPYRRFAGGRTAAAPCCPTRARSSACPATPLRQPVRPPRRCPCGPPPNIERRFLHPPTPSGW